MTKRRPSYREMARIEDEKVAEGREAEGLVGTTARVSQNLGHVLTMQFSPDEFASIRKKAEARGLGVAEYVRETLLGASD